MLRCNHVDQVKHVERQMITELKHFALLPAQSWICGPVNHHVVLRRLGAVVRYAISMSIRNSCAKSTWKTSLSRSIGKTPSHGSGNWVGISPQSRDPSNANG